MPVSYTPYDNDSVDVDPESPIFHMHLSRYWWARQQASGAAVLDCASGKGYGTFILAAAARSALGIDLNSESLAMARRAFQRPNLEYRMHDVLRVRELDRRFGLITAFEIIEHIEAGETDRFLKDLAACLQPGGKLLLSTPNHTVVTRSGSMVPEYHINNFTPRRLRHTLLRHFSGVTLLGQFRTGGPLYRTLFAMDVWNLRHVAGRPLRALLGRTPPEAAAGERAAGAGSLTAAGYFEAPPAACRDYRFSRWHWRQAGITVAVCEAPRP